MKINNLKPNLFLKRFNPFEGVVLDIRYACGCGFKDKDIKTAAAHVRETGHMVAGIHGEIRRDPRWVKETTSCVL